MSAETHQARQEARTTREAMPESQPIHGSTPAAPRVVLIGDRRANEAAGMVHDIQATPAEIVAQTWYGDEAVRSVETLKPDAVIIDLAPSIDASIQTLRQLTAVDPLLPIVVLPPDGGELAARSLVVSNRMEVVAKPLRPWTLADVLARMLGEPGTTLDDGEAPARAAARGRVIAVIGAKGGVGTTSFAVNLGVALRRAGAQRVSLVDLNIEQGDVALATDIVPGRSITDLAREGDRVEPDLVASYLTEHASGLRVLPAPARPAGAIVDPSMARRIIQMVARQSGFVLLDLPRGLAPLQRAALQASDWILVVIGNDVSSVKNGRLFLDAIDVLEKGPNQTQVILSQVAGRDGLSERECERALGRRVFMTLPHERLLQTAWNEGRTVLELTGRSSYSRAVTRIAGVFVPSGRRRRGGWRRALPGWPRRRAAASEQEAPEWP